MSQASLARMIGVSTSTISCLEQGKGKKPPYSLVEALAQYFCVDVSRFAREKDLQPIVDPKLIPHLIHHLDKNDLETVAGIFQRTQQRLGELGVYKIKRL